MVSTRGGRSSSVADEAANPPSRRPKESATKDPGKWREHGSSSGLSVISRAISFAQKQII